MRRARVLVLILGVAAGCDKPPPPAAGTPPPATGTPPTGRPVTPGPQAAPPASVPPAATPAAFLQAVRGGTATAAQLTPRFKKLIAPPATTADQAAGFSDWAAGQYLTELAGQVSTDVVAGAGDGPVVAATPGRRRTLLRLAGGQADWLQVTDLPAPAAGDDTFFAAAAFAQAVLDRRTALVADLLTPAARAALAAPRDAAETALGYSPGILTLKLNRLRGRATGAALDPAAGPAARAGTLTEPGAPPRPFRLTLAKAGGEYRVDGFEPN